MFGLGKKKPVDIEKVHTLQEALRAISRYIYLEEWWKAKSAIQNLRKAETEAYKEFEYKIRDNYKEIAKEKKIFDKTMKQIDKLEWVYEIKKSKYEKKLEVQRFKIRFNKIKLEIKKLTQTGNNTEALNLLNHFFEETQWHSKVIPYYTKQKRIILRNIKRKQNHEKNKISTNKILEWIKIANLTFRKKQEEKKIKTEERLKKKEEKWYNRIKNFINFHKKLREKYQKKKLIDEIKLLIEEDDKAKKEIASKKLEYIHKWLIKEVEKNSIIGYDLYGKILWSDTISWDSIWFLETWKKYSFYIWDATWHGVRAWLIVSVLSKTYQEHGIKDDIINLTYEVNNTLKNMLQSKNFVTGMFFEIDKDHKNAFNVTGMWHEPLMIYRNKAEKIEKIRVGWIAWGIRLIKQKEDIIPKTIELWDNDIVLTYSDWVLESRNEKWELYGIKRLEDIFLSSAKNNTDIRKIYKDIIEDLKLFISGWSFHDDTTILMFRRNPLKDIITRKSTELQKIKIKEWLNNKEAKKLEWKTIEEINEKLKEIKRDKQIVQIVNILKWLYYTWEFLRLKQEALRYIKDWFTHKDINYYLKKAMQNEEKYAIKQKNEKLENKYNVLTELCKKKDYNTVIKECNEIISKDWNI